MTRKFIRLVNYREQKKEGPGLGTADELCYFTFTYIFISVFDLVKG